VLRTLLSLLLELFIGIIVIERLKNLAKPNFNYASFFLDYVSIWIDRLIIVFCNELIYWLND